MANKINKTFHFYARFISAGFLCITTGDLIAAHVTSFVEPNVQQVGKITVITMPTQSSQSQADTIDFVNAIPMPLPKAAPNSVPQDSNTPPVFPGRPGFSPGSAGNGKRTPRLMPRSNFIGGQSGVSPQEFGTNTHPYTTSLVDAVDNKTSTYYPYRASGALYFKIGANTYSCSASLIRKGLIVTAAHCVTDFGSGSFFSQWKFVPALNGNSAPYGIWTSVQAVLNTSYFKGTDSCAERGVVCQNDVAVIRLAPQSNNYPGTWAGWYGYGWDGYSYTSFLGRAAVQISQLGYPGALNSGTLMQRTDSLGYSSKSNSNNTIIGSLQTEGSSGGPWLVNLGMASTLNGTSVGEDAVHNVVVGVTSWGYNSDAVKEQGASSFTSNNIKSLVNFLCTPATNPGC